MHYNNDGSARPMRRGEKVIIVDDGQGYCGTINVAVVDSGVTLWYNVAFPSDSPSSGREDEEGGTSFRVWCYMD